MALFLLILASSLYLVVGTSIAIDWRRSGESLRRSVFVGVMWPTLVLLIGMGELWNAFWPTDKGK